MAVSGSTDFSVNRNELILDALTLIGVRDMDESITNSDLQLASRTLNMMLKAWQTKGLQLWQRRSTSITMVASTTSYSMGPSGADVTVGRPLKIVEVRLRETSTSDDTILTKLTQNEYLEMSNKSTTGQPHSYYYDPQLTNGQIYLYPTPDTTTASDYTVQLTYHKPTDDMDAATDDFEFPQEWLEAIKYGLAVRLAPMYGVPLDVRKLLLLEFQPMLEEIESWDQEDGSIYLQYENR
jgi:hypothetical protein